MRLQRKLTGLLLIALFIVAACSPREKISPEPLDHALGLIGLNAGTLVRPLTHEEGYNLVARNPLVDHVAESPFYLHGWADETAAAVQGAARQGLFKLMDTAADRFAGMAGEAELRGPKLVRPVGIAESYRHLFNTYGRQPPPGSVQAIVKTGFSKAFDRQLGALIAALTEAADLCTQALSDLSSDEIDFIRSRPDRFFYPTDNYFKFLTAATHSQTTLVALARKIDFQKFMDGTSLMLTALDNFNAYLRRDTAKPAAERFFKDNRPHNGVVMKLLSPLGDIVVLGPDDNEFGGPAALLVDLGGNDHYTGPIGVGHLTPGSLSVAVDIEGNDRYDRQHDDYGQGFGALAVGLLVDLAGDDRYQAGNMAQGCGIMGVGLLADLAGADEYRMSLMGQGMGVFGMGALVDSAGNDRYLLAGLGQGVGATMGWGLLADLGGNDKYLVQRQWNRSSRTADKWSHVQGAGLSIRSFDWTRGLSLYGGIGFLSDGGGNDFYSADGGNCMGSAYFMSIGALVDDSGDDKYLPGGGYGLGFAVHLANGILIERKGNDYYSGQTLTGGAASDRSIAMLADYAGNDIYGPSAEFMRREVNARAKKNGTELTQADREDRIQAGLADVSYGAAMKRKALGFLIDYRGSDSYYARSRGWGESLGGVMPPSQPHLWSHALMLDLGGKDLYFNARRQNDYYAVYFDHGVFYDCTDLPSGENLPARWSLPIHLREMSEGISEIKEIEGFGLGPDIRELQRPGLWQRFRALGKIIQKGTSVVPALVALLKISNNTEINRDLLEAVIVLTIEEASTIDKRRLAELLTAQDPFVRRFAASYLGWWQVTSAEEALIGSLENGDMEIREMVLHSLARIGTGRALSVVIEGTLSDPSPEVRRQAFDTMATLAAKPDIAVNRVVAEKLMAALLEGLKDPDEIVRTNTARGLLTFNGRLAVIKALEKCLEDKSVYVRRAAARTLCLSGIKGGVPVLIDSLQFPSIDTFEFYDNELAKDLAFFTGIDFNEKERYIYETWHDWWGKNGVEVDLLHNLDIRKKIETAFAQPREDQGIEIFTNLMAENPDNIVIQKRYQRFCMEWITFRLLQQPVITSNIVARCLALQKILVELEPGNQKNRAQLIYFQNWLSSFDAERKIDSSN